MKKLMISAAFAATALSIPASAAAQRADILIVDSDRVLSDCTACKSANTQLQQKQAALQSRAEQLRTQLQTEGKPIQAAVDAVPQGKEPDAALSAKISAFQTKERNAQQELAASKNSLDSTLANVQSQIGSKLIAVVEQVRARRAASVVFSKNSTIASDTAIDVTGEVLAALNQQLPSVSVTPMPQQTQKQQPQGR
jgi:outer membrane protein